MARIAEIMQKFSVCCPKATCGWPALYTGKSGAVSLGRSDCFTISLRLCRHLLLQGPDEMETLILTSLCVGAAAGVRLRVFVLFPLIFLCAGVVTAWGLAQNQTVW